MNDPEAIGEAALEPGESAPPTPHALRNWISIREAARQLGISPRTVYGYAETGRLPFEQREDMRMVDAEAVAALVRRAPGRVRTSTPDWHQPPELNPLTLTTITVSMRPGQQEALEAKLTETRQQNTHRLPGTAARYIMQDRNDPGKVRLVLLWRSSALPSAEEIVAAMEALRVYLADVLDWNTAVVEEGLVLLHAQ